MEEGRGAKLKEVGFDGLMKASLLRGDNRFHETKDITFPQTVHIDCRRNHVEEDSEEDSDDPNGSEAF